MAHMASNEGIPENAKLSLWFVGPRRRSLLSLQAGYCRNVMAFSEAKKWTFLSSMHLPTYREHILALLSILRIAADGAGNLLHRMHSDSCSMIPDIVCGDLDSITSESLRFFESKGATVIRVEEQETTDFTKCTKAIIERAERMKLQLEMLIAVGGLCGRSDHVFGCVQTMFLYQDEYPEVPLFLWHKESLIFLLPQGQHMLLVDRWLTTGKCGLIPIGCPVKQIFTSGLRWDLNGTSLAFGKVVSSSNEVVSNQVTVNTSDTVLFTLELNTEHLKLAPVNRKSSG